MGYKSDKNKRTEQFNVKVTEDELEKYRRLVKLQGKPLSEITRMLLDRYIAKEERRIGRKI